MSKRNKDIKMTIFIMVAGIGLIVAGVIGIVTSRIDSREYKSSTDIRKISAVIVDFSTKDEKDDSGDVKYTTYKFKVSYGIWQSNDVYFVVIYYAIPAYYPELELQIVFLSGFNANHLYKAKSRKAWIIHRCLAVSLYLQMCYFREWSLTGQPTNIADDEH